MKITICLILCVVLIVVIGFSCFCNWVVREGPKTTNTASSKFKTKNERIAFLKQYVKLFSSVNDTEFHINFCNGSEGAPGPSEWNMEVVMKVEEKDLDKWVSGLVEDESSKEDLAWGYALIKGKPDWKITSKPKVYKRGIGTVVAVFETEGIVFKKIVAY